MRRTESWNDDAEWVIHQSRVKGWILQSHKQMHPIKQQV